MQLKGKKIHLQQNRTKAKRKKRAIWRRASKRLQSYADQRPQDVLHTLNNLDGWKKYTIAQLRCQFFSTQPSKRVEGLFFDHVNWDKDHKKIK